MTAIPAEASGVTMENRYNDPAMWGDRYNEFMMGASGSGVAIGDYDQDGRPDIFIASKTESCRLFRNLGNWKFADVTEQAGVADHGAAAQVWKQGVAFVDVNNDGLPDIYACRFGAPNLLYINQGNGTFKEEAAARGLALNDASAMASFCDYDRDGWLDVYIVTNLLDAAKHPKGQIDHLYHNNGDGTFTEVTEKAGISGEGQGHAATWWDYNQDGWPDLYVSNDFDAPDKLYRNNRDGTFTDVIQEAVPHMPYSSMGADFGDINGDGLVDFFASDMAATTHVKDQRTVAIMRGAQPEPADGSLAPQIMRNALYLNAGGGHFLEAAELVGLAATDWTWAPRFEDFDNDGRIDLVVTNGMVRETHNADITAKKLVAASFAEKMQAERATPPLAEKNLAFRNLGNLRFEDVSDAWGMNLKGVSFGLATGDLDGDGDLDIVYVNYQGDPTLLRNDCDHGHSVVFALRGKQSNRYGIGALVKLETAQGVQVKPLALARGVLSTSEPVLHFGLGDETVIQTVTIDWPSGRRQILKNLSADRRFLIDEDVSLPTQDFVTAAPSTLFVESNESLRLNVVSRETLIDETVQQRLLPFRQNRRGPALAIGPLFKNDADDIVLGGTPQTPLRVFSGGESVPFAVSKTTLNDGPILIFDANGDGLNDLLVTKSGTALLAGSPEYQPTLYIGAPDHSFRPAPSDRLPSLPVSVGAVAAADFDRDGQLDLFIGGRTLPGMYPLAPPSALWRNDHGRFKDVTDTIAPSLRNIGMVTGALWSDVDQDGWLDLLLTIEWGPVIYLHNESGRGFTDWTDRAGFANAGTGWWNGIVAGDFNEDGIMDYAVGNVGLNTPYQGDRQHPVTLFAGDFTGSGALQLVEASYEGDKLYPWRTRVDLGAAIPAVLKKYPRNDYYARATLEEILGPEKLAAAQRFEATELRSGVFLSQKDGGWRFTPFPPLAQIAPIQGLAVADFDGDGHLDICVTQNSYAPVAYTGRFDGGLGQYLRGNGRGEFEAVPASASGLYIPGDARAAAVIDFDRDGSPDLIVSRNNSSLLAFRNSGSAPQHRLVVKLEGLPGNASAAGARVTLELTDGSSRATEVYLGSGYFSQSSTACSFAWSDRAAPKTLHIRWPDGQTTDRVVDASETFLKLAQSKP